MKQLAAGELGVFCEQLAMILRAGIPIADGLELMHEALEEGAYKALLDALLKALQEGNALCDAFESVGAFPN